MRNLVDVPVRVAQELSWQVSVIEDRDQLEAALLQSLVSVFQADYCGWSDHAMQRADRVRMRIYPYQPSHDSVVAALAKQVTRESVVGNPVMNHYFDRRNSSQPVRVSDLVSDRMLRKTAGYNETFRALGCDYQIAVLTRRVEPGNASAYALARSRSEFSDEALATAHAVQPVLVALQAAARVGPADAAAAAEHRLTPRELDILRLVAAGMTADAIGHIRRISPRTVRKHLEHTYAKLGHHDRLSAVLYARSVGILSRSTPVRLAEPPVRQSD